MRDKEYETVLNKVKELYDYIFLLKRLDSMPRPFVDKIVANKAERIYTSKNESPKKVRKKSQHSEAFLKKQLSPNATNLIKSVKADNEGRY